jgi:hypothetical protein
MNTNMKIIAAFILGALSVAGFLALSGGQHQAVESNKSQAPSFSGFNLSNMPGGYLRIDDRLYFIMMDRAYPVAVETEHADWLRSYAEINAKNKGFQFSPMFPDSDP